jgi:hypothetical protein
LQLVILALGYEQKIVYGQAFRSISTGQLHALLRFHTQPINLVVSKGSYLINEGISCLEVGFPLRCLQRLSLPDLANQLCHWRDNWYTRGLSTPVLSY